MIRYLYNIYKCIVKYDDLADPFDIENNQLFHEICEDDDPDLDDWIEEGLFEEANVNFHNYYTEHNYPEEIGRRAPLILGILVGIIVLFLL